jgi:hypothetical protein
MIFLLYLSIPIGIDPVETNEALGKKHWGYQLCEHRSGTNLYKLSMKAGEIP